MSAATTLFPRSGRSAWSLAARMVHRAASEAQARRERARRSACARARDASSRTPRHGSIRPEAEARCGRREVRASIRCATGRPILCTLACNCTVSSASRSVRMRPLRLQRLRC
eukprot:scaffold2744_cov104-Isochrysis_galbana.AAC.3